MIDTKEKDITEILEILLDNYEPKEQLDILSACMMGILKHNNCTDFTSVSYDDEYNKYTFNIHVEELNGDKLC